MGLTAIERIIEQLRIARKKDAVYPGLSLAQLSEATGVKKSTISTALTHAIANGEPIERVGTGVYALKNTETVVDFDVATQTVSTAGPTDVPLGESPKLRGSALKVARLCQELSNEITYLARDMEMWREKAKRYDELSLKFRGFSAPGRLD